MRSRATHRRHECGQSAMEFALMLPMLLFTIFFVIQASVIFSMIHQASWTSFATARYHRVACYGPGDCSQNPVAEYGNHQLVVFRILYGGRLWQQALPRWEVSDSVTGNDEGPLSDGGHLAVSWATIDAALPYWPRMLGCAQALPGRSLQDTTCVQWTSFDLPTHLGPNVYADGIRKYGNRYGARHSGREKRFFTDNNIEDDD